jgi:hypothetical protein
VKWLFGYPGFFLPWCESACNFDPLNRGIGVQN